MTATTTRPSPKERVAARLQARFPHDQIEIDGAWVRVSRDFAVVLHVLPMRRRFAIPGVQWPVQGDYSGANVPEDLADAAADALEAVEAERSRGRRSPGNAPAGRERAMDRVQKLLALAADQLGKPEGETAARLALKVMSEAGLIDGDVSALQIVQRRIGRAAPWNRELWSACCEHVGAVILEDTHVGGFVIFGTEDQLDLAAFVHHVVARGLLAEREEDASYAAGEFLCTAVCVVRKRLRVMRARARRVDAAGDDASRKRASRAAAWAAVRLDVAPMSRAPRADEIAPMPVAAGAEAGRRVPIVTALRGGA